MRLDAFARYSPYSGDRTVATWSVSSAQRSGRERASQRHGGGVMFDYLSSRRLRGTSCGAPRDVGRKRVLVIDRATHRGTLRPLRRDGFSCTIRTHIFHELSRDLRYLGHFTAWRPYEHRVLASVDGQLVPIPINLDTINRLYGLSLNTEQVEGFLASRAIKIDAIRTSEDVVLARVGRELYEKFFKNYTRKQWGLDPSELDASVRRASQSDHRDARYFSDRFQAMPALGYTRMFARMLGHRTSRSCSRRTSASSRA